MNLKNSKLALIFQINEEIVINIFNTWLIALHEVLFQKQLKDIPARDENKLSMPFFFFLSSFINCRIILDVVEFYVQPEFIKKKKNWIHCSACISVKLNTVESFPQWGTVKGLIGVAPNGVITFMSNLYPSSISNEKIILDSSVCYWPFWIGRLGYRWLSRKYLKYSSSGSVSKQVSFFK